MQLRIASLNVWALPEPLADDVLPRMRAIADRLSSLGLDAIAFQEVWTREACRALVSGGRRAGLVHAWHRDAGLGGSGLLVLSRQPFAEVRFERFSLRGQPERVDHGDYFGGKGFVRLRLRTPGGPVTLMDTHLHARYPGDADHEYRGTRAGQTVQLAMAALDTHDPILAAGDFNFGEQHAEYAVLTGLTGLRDTAAELDRRRATVRRSNRYRRGRRRPDKRIDYVFARDGSNRGVRVRDVRAVFDEPIQVAGRAGSYSDHDGVMARIEIEPRPATALPTPSPRAVALAEQLLSEGRAEAERRQRGGRAWAGASLTVAALASAGLRSRGMTRRRLLRGSLQGAALAALTPGLGFGVLAELFVPDELRAFDRLAARLARVDRRASRESLA